MDPKKASLRTRLRYRFDNTVSRGTLGLIAWLGLVTAALILTAGAVIKIFDIHPPGEKNLSFGEGAWRSLMRTLDPGTMGGDVGNEYRLVAFLITIIGIFLVSILIGLITTGIESRIEELRKGRTPVIETNHTLILGWSEKLHSIISELLIANANQSKPRIIVMAPRDKVDMEDEIFARIPGKLGPTKIICRTGDPTDPNDLELVNVPGSRAVIVLSPDDEDAPDPHAVKVVLGLMRFDREFENLRVIVELAEEQSAEALQIATGGRIRTVVSTDIIARITAQVCRQVGMSLVYGELLDFDGDELYFTSEPKLHGETYGQALLSYETSSIIGIRSASGDVRVNPPMDTVINDGDQVIAISEDDDTVVMSSLDAWRASAEEAARRRDVAEQRPEHTLVMGWSAMAPRILRELDKYVAAGSSVTVVVESDLVPEIATGDVDLGLERLELRVVTAEGDEAGVLRREIARMEYDQVVLLSYRDVLPVSEADSRTLLSLLQLRRIMREVTPGRDTSIVTELLDVRAVQLAQVANPDDFVVSERLTSLLLAQLSENPELDLVFRELMDADGSEITLQPVEAYGVAIGAGDGDARSATYRSLVEAARAHGHTAIGFRSDRLTPEIGLGGGVVVNPAKSQSFELAEGDQLIVIAE